MIRFILVSLWATSSAWALDFKVVGPCSETPLVATTVAADATTLGDLTVNTLTALGIPFEGGNYEISTIANSPKGDAALEVISDTKMRAYGWCVEVDGTQPDQMPDAVPVTAATKSVTWFYASSLYDAGVWKDYCTPSWQTRSQQICGK